MAARKNRTTGDHEAERQGPKPAKKPTPLGTDPAQATQVSVTFTAVAEGTEVVLTHTDWYRRPDGVRARTGYVTGWDHVLGRFREALN